MALTDPRLYHVLSYGTYLGSTFFQSFVGGVTAYRSLPRPMFGRLQEATFPVYFSLQSALGAAMLLTRPDTHDVYPLGIIVGTSLVNLLVLGPATTRAMKDRRGMFLVIRKSSSQQ